MSLMDNVKELDTKQKIMLVATVGCLALVAYLGYTTFFPSTSSDPSPQPINNPAMPKVSASPVTQVSPTQTAPQMATNDMPTSSGLPVALPTGVNNMVIQPSASPTPENLALLAESQQMQQQYVNLVNAYQLAQLQQKLIQINAQIASSKLSTAKTLVELNKIQPLLGQGGDSSSLGSLTNNNDQSTKQPGGYHTLYVGQVGGRWQAMLQGYGQYFQVNNGMHLPDGSTVSQISAKGVVLSDPNGTPFFLPMSKSLS